MAGVVERWGGGRVYQTLASMPRKRRLLVEENCILAGVLRGLRQDRGSWVQSRWRRMLSLT